MNRSLVVFLSLLLAGPFTACGQVLNHKKSFTLQDSLRGSVTPERAWWDVTHYALGIAPDFTSQTIEGKNEISFRVLKAGRRMQLDLQAPMELRQVTWKGVDLKLERLGHVYYVHFPQELPPGANETITALYGGKPRAARNAPWDGGWIWKKDALGRPFISVAVQGLGASAWYPCKDYQGDEPDSASLSVAVPDTLVAVANGRLAEQKSHSPGMMTYKWSVDNPINNYNLVPYIGKYVHFSETYSGESGKLDCSYWVLDYNLDKAKKQFTQAGQTLKAFEHWFGPYPFYEDGFKLVEAPHLGMEHQSAVAYGNKYMNGYLGKDLSGSGWGLKWDFIIVHEVGHEWFGNNITTRDIADMWVHEGFTSYSETLFTEYHYGKEAANAYIQGVRQNIQNDIPIIGHYGVNQEGSGDMYSKAANMLHTIRQVIDNDTLFRSILRGLGQEFHHQTVTTQQVEQYISQRSGKDFSKVFDQYLRTTKIPVLEIKSGKDAIEYRWTNCIAGFNLPVRLTSGQWLHPTTEKKQLKLSGQKPASVKVDPNFYIEVKKVE